MSLDCVWFRHEIQQNANGFSIYLKFKQDGNLLPQNSTPAKWRLIDSGFVARGKNNGSHCSAVTFLHAARRQCDAHIGTYSTGLPGRTNVCHISAELFGHGKQGPGCWLAVLDNSTGKIFKFSSYCCRWCYWKVLFEAFPRSMKRLSSQRFDSEIVSKLGDSLEKRWQSWTTVFDLRYNDKSYDNLEDI